MPHRDDTSHARAGAHCAAPRVPVKRLSALVSVLVTATIALVALGLSWPPGDPVIATAGAEDDDSSGSSLENSRLEPVRVPVERKAPETPELPKNSGSGKRIVYDQDNQRVWLVGGKHTVDRTYLVSGSRLDNVKPGKYRVQAKFRHVQAYDSSGSMGRFVQFAHGKTAAIGFHDIPRDNDGKRKQGRGELGNRKSDGCVRQWQADAKALWKFAKVGTRVVVTS